MSEYVIREGVVLADICDQYILVSTLACREKCPYVKRINDTAAFYWKLLEQGKSVQEMAECAAAEFGIENKEDLYSDIEEYIELLKYGGYLLSDEELSSNKL